MPRGGFRLGIGANSLGTKATSLRSKVPLGLLAVRYEGRSPDWEWGWEWARRGFALDIFAVNGLMFMYRRTGMRFLFGALLEQSRLFNTYFAVLELSKLTVQHHHLFSGICVCLTSLTRKRAATVFGDLAWVGGLVGSPICWRSMRSPIIEIRRHKSNHTSSRDTDTEHLGTVEVIDALEIGSRGQPEMALQSFRCSCEISMDDRKVQGKALLARIEKPGQMEPSPHTPAALPQA